MSIPSSRELLPISLHKKVWEMESPPNSRPEQLERSIQCYRSYLLTKNLQESPRARESFATASSETLHVGCLHIIRAEHIIRYVASYRKVVSSHIDGLLIFPGQIFFPLLHFCLGTPQRGAWGELQMHIAGFSADGFLLLFCLTSGTGLCGKFNIICLIASTCLPDGAFHIFLTAL